MTSTFGAIFGLLTYGFAGATTLSERLDAVHENFLENRRAAFSGLSDPFGVPSAAKVVIEAPMDAFRKNTTWKRNVVATVFWVGEQPTENNPTPNDKSAWDQNWMANFGGYDDPNNREGFFPKNIVPKINPFYVALPYNDIGKDFRHRLEAAEVIPWFWEKYQGEGISVCKSRWLAIHYKGKIEYVFGNENARPNRNKAAGLDVSPAVRDFLEMPSGERVEWKFVEDHEVPKGPWKWGSTSFKNN